MQALRFIMYSSVPLHLRVFVPGQDVDPVHFDHLISQPFRIRIDRDGYAAASASGDCEPQVFEPVHISRCLIDMNSHVNNARYLDITDEFLPDGAEISRVRCEYKMPVQRDSVVIPKVYKSGNIITVDLTDTGGKSYAAAEYTLNI